MKVVIIGGVAGGMSAATRLRRLREDAEIIVYEKGPYETPESLWRRFRLDVRVNSEVVGIDREKKTITATNAQGKSEIEEYDFIIISPGANPRKLPIEGIERAVVLKDVEDSVRIKELVDANKCSPRHKNHPR
jgi:NADPH-dependent 2,4-dienoyl-CoA reductase/sulfur reductase-like enzyme